MLVQLPWWGWVIYFAGLWQLGAWTGKLIRYLWDSHKAWKKARENKA